MRPTVLLALLLVLSSQASWAQAPCPGPGFTYVASPTLAPVPTSVAIGDLNLDGIPDMVVTSEGMCCVPATTVTVHLGVGAGVFGPPLYLTAGPRPQFAEIADLDLDGDPDIAVVNFFSDDVSVFLGNGAGGFAPAVSHAVGFRPKSLVVGDFNTDGVPDLAVADTGIQQAPGTTVSVLLGNGAGGFAPAVTFATGAGPFTVASGDFDNDGDLDLVTANLASTDVTVLLGDGLGNFSGPLVVTTGISTVHVTVGDFDVDGNADLAVADGGTQAAPNATMRVLMGNGLGGFAPGANYATGNGPVSAVTGDFDLDGRPDIATANAVSNDVTVILGDGLGGFAAPVAFAAGMGPNSLAVGDFDQNGSPDLVATNYFSGNVTVLVNSCTRLQLVASQTGGPGSPVLIQNFNLTPGGEYYNIFSFSPCPTGMGTGAPGLLGLCFPTPADVQMLITQFQAPLGTAPFHFVATLPSMSFGPFPVPPMVAEGVCFEFTGGVLGPASGVARLVIR